MYKRGVGVVGEMCVSGGGSGGGMWVYVWQQQHKCLAKILQATHCASKFTWGFPTWYTI